MDINQTSKKKKITSIIIPIILVLIILNSLPALYSGRRVISHGDSLIMLLFFVGIYFLQRSLVGIIRINLQAKIIEYFRLNDPEYLQKYKIKKDTLSSFLFSLNSRSINNQSLQLLQGNFAPEFPEINKRLNESHYLIKLYSKFAILQIINVLSLVVVLLAFVLLAIKVFHPSDENIRYMTIALIPGVLLGVVMSAVIILQIFRISKGS